VDRAAGHGAQDPGIGFWISVSGTDDVPRVTSRRRGAAMTIGACRSTVSGDRRATPTAEPSSGRPASPGGRGRASDVRPVGGRSFFVALAALAQRRFASILAQD